MKDWAYQMASRIAARDNVPVGVVYPKVKGAVRCNQKSRTSKAKSHTFLRLLSDGEQIEKGDWFHLKGKGAAKPVPVEIVGCAYSFDAHHLIGREVA